MVSEKVYKNVMKYLVSGLSSRIQNRIFQTFLLPFLTHPSYPSALILLILKSWLAGRGVCRSVCSVRRPAVREKEKNWDFL